MDHQPEPRPPRYLQERVTRILEITPHTSTPGRAGINDATAEITASLQLIRHKELSIIPVSGATPWILVQTINTTAAEVANLLKSKCDVTELRRHWNPGRSPQRGLRELIQHANSHKQTAVGRAAIERALQRHRLDILVLASDSTAEYNRSIRAILERHPSATGVQVIGSDICLSDLGMLTGCKRTGSVGLLRGECVRFW